MTDFQHALKGIMLALFGFSLFSVGDVFAKYIGDRGYEPEQVGFWVCLFALVGFLSIAPEIGGLKETFKTKKLHFHILRGIMGMGSFFFIVNGFKELGMALTYTLVFASPFIAAILSAVILKEKFGIHRWISIALGFIGVLVVLRPGSAPLEFATIGVLIAACLHASSNIIIRKIGKEDPIIAFAFYNALVGLIAFSVVNFAKNGMIPLPPIEDLTFFASVMFFHIGGTFAVTRAFNETETALVAPVHYVQLLWGVFFGYILFETAIDLWTTIGAGIIVLSGIYMIWREKVNHVTITRGPGMALQTLFDWRATLRMQRYLNIKRARTRKFNTKKKNKDRK